MTVCSQPLRLVERLGGLRKAVTAASWARSSASAGSVTRLLAIERTQRVSRRSVSAVGSGGGGITYRMPTGGNSRQESGEFAEKLGLWGALLVFEADDVGQFYGDVAGCFRGIPLN